jgi:outer membrane autotransporter protein
MWRAGVEAGYRLPMADNVNLIPQAQLHVGKGSVKDFTIGGLSYSVHAKAIATGRIGMGVEFANVEVGDMLVTAQTTVSLLRDLNKGGYATVGGQRVESSLARTRLQLHSIVHMHLPDSAATLFFQSSFSHSLKGPKRREMLVSGGVKIAF